MGELGWWEPDEWWPMNELDMLYPDAFWVFLIELLEGDLTLLTLLSTWDEVSNASLV